MDNSKETITTRKQEQRSPKVGDSVSYPSGNGVLIIDEPDKYDVVIIKDELGEYRRVSVFALKPAQEHTEQELLAYELYTSIGRKLSLDECKEVGDFYYKNCLKIAESGRFK